ncbi:hypothetical protein BD289DRAFT_450297 [Coniella lustricola]|uniref:Uncharacterized protein n=1 Tax=Coniella lustricola TaxID=2025994 RepID=A0A2T3AIX3_9PEZI|nr:hypothetical protein BD289DRAFT_450297 [Coniella lustricola]
MAPSTNPKLSTQSSGQPEPSQPAALLHSLPLPCSDHSSNGHGTAKPSVDTGSDLDIDGTTTKDQPDTEVEGDGDAAEMPKPRLPPVRREIDISSILNSSQRVELTRLSEAILAKLEENLQKPFNFLDHPVAQVNRVQIFNYAPVVAAQKAEFDAANKTSTEASSAPANGMKQDTIPEDGEAPESKPQFVPKIDVNSVKPMPSTMSVLKDDTNLYFNKWKHALHKRLNDLITPSQSTSSAGSSRQGQGGSRGGGAGGGPAGKNQQQVVNKGTAYQADLYLIRRFPPVETPLCHLPVDKRRFMIHIMCLLNISTEHYISHSRIYMMYLASSLHIPAWVLKDEENRIARGLGKIYKTLCEEADLREQQDQKLAEELQQKQEAETAGAVEGKETTDKQEKGRGSRTQGIKSAKESRKKWRPSANSAQVGRTLLNAGIGMIEAAQGLPPVGLPAVSVAHLMGPLGDCETAVGVFFGVNPTRSRVVTFESLAANLQNGAFIPLHSSTNSEMLDSKKVAAEDRRMRIVYCVDGLVNGEAYNTEPWQCLDHGNEVVAIRWETEPLGKSAWPEALLRVSKIVDNAWVMALTKCSKLEQVLSDAIIGHVHGERGVSLIGYGLGARAIYLCLSHLAERKQYGLVDTVVLMGAPVPSDAGIWSALKSVVTGRLVNVYSPTDYMLAFASRQTAFHFGVAGLQQIQGVGGIENHDVSDVLKAHLDYTSLVPTILKRIAWEEIKEDLKAQLSMPKGSVAVQQKLSMAPAKKPVFGPVPPPAKPALAEHKENAQPQRGGRAARGGGRGGGRNGNGNNKRLAEQMGKMDL